MSEPVTHSEIEDVLSSIRRLVSEDGREMPVPRMPAAPAKPAARLVLTPSLRVADVEVEPKTHDTSVTDISIDDVPANTPSSPAGTLQGQPDSDLLRPEVFVQPETAPEVEVVVEQEDSLPVTEAEAEIELDADSSAVETPSQGDDAIAAAAEQAQTEQAQTEDAPWTNPRATLFAAAGVTDEMSDSESETKTATSNEPEPAVSFADKIAALEAAIGQTDEQWEPDGEIGDANAGTPVETLAWEDIEDEGADDGMDLNAGDDLADAGPQVDITPAVTEPEPEPEFLDASRLAEHAVADEVLSEVTADEAVMDEESLRELVADIVREELQGALGERITRNVRKLVRREIHRALAVQDLG